MKIGDTYTLEDGSKIVVDEAFVAASAAGARNATLEDLVALGREHGEADAWQACADLVVKGLAKSNSDGNAKKNARVVALRAAGVSEDKLDAYVASCTSTFLKRMWELTT
jgi:hypothetical protein